LRGRVGAQRRLLAMKARDEAGIMTPDARHELARHLERFLTERLSEGWHPSELTEAFYLFERVGRWAATGPRRAAVLDDVFSPFCSRVFLEYCFSMSSRERFVEAPHYRLLIELSPPLRDHRFEEPFGTRRAWLAPALATQKLARAAIRYSWRVGVAGVDAPTVADQPFQQRWLEARLPLLADLFFSQDSELWSFISRRRVEEMLAGTPTDRARSQEALLRATTIFWHYHYRDCARDSPLEGAGLSYGSADLRPVAAATRAQAETVASSSR
jgi:hypothetical protein